MSIGQGRPSRLLGQATAAQIEHRGRIELTNGGAVGAGHVIRVDLKLGLGIQLRPAGEQEAADVKGRVALLRLGKDVECVRSGVVFDCPAASARKRCVLVPWGSQ